MTDNHKLNIVEVLDKMESLELGKIKVFVVEDDLMILDLVTTKLMQSGCFPFSTSNGSEAIEMAKQFNPDIIILDLMLPGMTGEEILTVLKSSEDLKHIPVIVFSNKSEEVEKENVMRLGAAKYFIKAATDLNYFVEEIKSLAKKE